MLLDSKNGPAKSSHSAVLEKAGYIISACIRDTDVSGWYQEKSAIGVILTEIADRDPNSIQPIISARVKSSLDSQLGGEVASSIVISFHVFREEWNDKNDSNGNTHSANIAFYPDLNRINRSKQLPRLVKRAMDIGGSTLAMLLLSPLFLAVGLAIKLTSTGPIFFKQGRVGQFGTTFTFLKFRSMYVENDSSAHREFVERFIAGEADPGGSGQELQAVYKITHDPRVTRVGKLLRKASIDELPQLWNVLRGEMSLVGPRPPLPYEMRAYDVWHRRRILEVKPGITGLWQVHGRSRTTFDEMVRLDLRYAREWSLWLDIKILLKTPKAVVSCDGAY